MGIQMTAVVKKENAWVAAPYEAFAGNENVAAYNDHFKQMYEDKEFCELYNMTGTHVNVPEMNATSRRRSMLNIILGINFEESVQHFTPAQVAAFTEILAKGKNASSLILKAAFGLNKQDYDSTIEFFEICAKEGYGISFG